MSDTPSTERTVRIVFYCLLALILCWVFAIPEFPTLDGPLHLYYAHVLGKLLSGSEHFQHYYAIRHYFPPYCTHIYLILGLELLLPLTLVTKTMVAICIALNTCGLRFLIRSFGQRDAVFSLFAIPLSLSWPLFMGFFPYLLGLGMMFFAIGVWCRMSRSFSRSRATTFLLLVALLVLTHPMTLLMLMLFCACELASRLLRCAPGTSFRSYLPDLGILSASTVLCCYVLFFVGSNTGLNEPATKWPITVLSLVTGEYVTAFIGSGASVLRLIHVLLLLFLFQCSLFGLPQRLRQRRWDSSDVLALLGAALLISLPLLPFRVNGGAFFNHRLVFVVWLIFIATAGTHLLTSLRVTYWLSAVAVVLTVLTLGVAQPRVLKVASDVSSIPTLEPTKNRVGILLAPYPDPPDNLLSFDPFLLSGAKVFLVSDAVLLNAPWLVSPASPLMGREGTLTDMAIAHPKLLLRSAQQDSALKARLITESDVIVTAGYDLSATSNFSGSVPEKAAWECTRTIAHKVCLKSNK